MPALRSSFPRIFVPSLVITAFLVGGLEASASQIGETLRDCGRSYAPCRLESLLVQSQDDTALPRVGATPAVQEPAVAQEETSA